MGRLSSPVLRCTRVLSTVLDDHVADVHVADDVTVYRHVLAYDKPAVGGNENGLALIPQVKHD